MKEVELELMEKLPREDDGDDVNRDDDEWTAMMTTTMTTMVKTTMIGSSRSADRRKR